MMRLRKFCQDRAGATAAEFALVLPVFGALTIGAINLCMVVYANSRMQFAVDDAARCLSVKTTICTGIASAQSHAAAMFGFSGLNPSFTASQGPCGSQVVGTVTYPLMAVVTTVSVPISASSCFPIQD
jgi:Flp pilus assembly protein TadG